MRYPPFGLHNLISLRQPDTGPDLHNLSNIIISSCVRGHNLIGCLTVRFWMRQAGQEVIMGAWDKGSTRRWRRIRAWVLEQNLITNGGRCTLGIKGVCTGVATQVHHIKGRAVTGDDPRYLAASCKECNLHIGDPNRNSPAPKRVSSW